MGSVETLPSGRHRAIAWNAKTQKREKVPNPNSRSNTFESWEAADAAWRRREDEIDGVYADARVPVARQRRRVTFREYAESWAKIQQGEKATRQNIRGAVRALCEHFGDQMIDEITATDVLSYFADQQTAGYAAKTRLVRKGYLAKMMQMAIQDHLRLDDPTVGVKIKETAPGRVRVLTEEELQRALDALPARLKAAAILAYDCGLRAGEVCGLRWFRVDLTEETMTVADVIEADGALREYPKGKQAAVIPLTPRAVEALTELRRRFPANDMEHVFRNTRGKQMTPSYLSDRWRTARKKAKLDAPAVKFHHLRHATATNLARADAPATVIQALLRHGDLATSQVYIEETSIAEQRRWMAIQRQGERAPVVPLRPAHARESEAKSAQEAG